MRSAECGMRNATAEADSGRPSSEGGLMRGHWALRATGRLMGCTGWIPSNAERGMRDAERNGRGRFG
jgi:hypothetical protein